MISKQELNTFYKRFWQDRSKIPYQMNKDERNRAMCILDLIHNHVKLESLIKDNFYILDLGCGRGWFTNILSEYGRVTGIDPVEASIVRAKQLFPDIDFRVGDASDIVLKEGTQKYHLIVSSEVIEHVPNDKKNEFMSWINNLLKPGGYAILTTPRGELRGAWQKRYPHLDQPVEDWLNEKQFKKYCVKAGFEVVKYERIFMNYFPNNIFCKLSTSKKTKFIRDVQAFNFIFDLLKYVNGLYQIILIKKVSP